MIARKMQEMIQKQSNHVINPPVYLESKHRKVRVTIVTSTPCRKQQNAKATFSKAPNAILDHQKTST